MIVINFKFSFFLFICFNGCFCWLIFNLFFSFFFHLFFGNFCWLFFGFIFNGGRFSLRFIFFCFNWGFIFSRLCSIDLSSFCWSANLNFFLYRSFFFNYFLSYFRYANFKFFYRVVFLIVFNYL